MGPVEVAEALEQRRVLVEKIREADHLLVRAMGWLKHDPGLAPSIEFLERMQVIARNTVDTIDEELYGAPPLKVSH